MSAIPHFARYAAAFETAYEKDDFKLVEPFFTEDAVYEVFDIPPPLGGVTKGRDAILSYFSRVLNGFDRRFATRKVSLIGAIREEGNAVIIRGSVTYTQAGVPDLTFELEERAEYRGDRIARLEDRYDAETVKRVFAYVAEHGKKLGLAGA